MENNNEIPKVVDQQMLDENPVLVKHGIKVGDPIELATEAQAKELDAAAASVKEEESTTNQEGEPTPPAPEPKTEEQPEPKTEEKPEPKEEESQSTTPAVEGSGEPKMRYRGHVILVDSERVVGSQTFHHIRTDEGIEYDMTDSEYAAEVKLAYPPQN